MSPWEVRVEKDVVMLPSEVAPESDIVEGLQRAIRSMGGEDAELRYGKGAFDAGGPTSMGIPTVMWGRPITSKDMMGDDYVSLRGVEEEAKILGRMIIDMLG
jgi:acetylornithine deacetylase/succinyl-diaminopimelate desuccinylase-like protein